jgi:outer membrane protein OmpA-like peptidoglycan-associated protein
MSYRNAVLLCLLAGITGFLQAQNTIGLKGDYYNDAELKTYAFTRIDKKIDFNWGYEGPKPDQVKGSYYSVRWTGLLRAPETGTYTFSARFDDGIRLWVNNKPMLDAWGLNDMADFSNTISLTAGKQYDIKVEYFNAMREGEITLLWVLPSALQKGRSPKPQPIGAYFLPPSETPKKAIEAPKEKPIALAKAPKKELPKQKTPEIREKPAPVKKKDTVQNLETYSDENPNLNCVYFLKGKETMLEKVVAVLQKNTKARLELSGYTDNYGDAAMNKSLSEKRAQVAAQYLIGRGIAPERLQQQGFGGASPIVSNPQNEAERALNRRVEFKVVF